MLHARHEKTVSFVDLAAEVSGVRQKLSEVHSVLVEKHAGDSGGAVFSVRLLNQAEDGVAHEVASVFTLQRIKGRNVDRRKVDLGCSLDWVLAWSGWLLSLRLMTLLLIRLVLFLETASRLASSLAASLRSSSASIVVLLSSVAHDLLLIRPSKLHMLLLFHFVPTC